MKTVMGKHVVITALFCCLFYLQGCFLDRADQFEITGSTMGTSYSVVVVDAPRSSNAGALKSQIDAELERINKLISTYDAASELSQFNASDSTEWTPLAAETIGLIKSARRVSKESDGAYDITLSTVSDLWGFGNQPVSQLNGLDAELPSLDQILEIMNEVGYQLLLISANEINVRKLTPHLKVDLSSIGKGYAVDRIGETLEANGVKRYLVDIGGEIRTRGKASDGKMWKVGIEVPQTGSSKASHGVIVENAHIATSGDYRNYREVDGRRVSHIIDGRTGFPIDHNLASVTILHGSTALADAWSTAFMTMGFDAAIRLANRKGIAAQFTLRGNGDFRVVQSEAFTAYAFSD